MNEPGDAEVTDADAADERPEKLPLPLGLSGLDAIALAVNAELKEGASALAKETGAAEVTIEIDGLASEQRLQAALAAAEQLAPPGVDVILLYCGRRVQREPGATGED